MGRVAFRLAWGAAALCLLTGGSAYAGLDQSLRVHVVRCENVRCETAEGLQGGLTVVNLQGSFPRIAGRALRVVVVGAADRRVVHEQKAGVMSNGSFESSIAAFRLPAGRYLFGLMTGPKQMIARGEIEVSRQAANDPTRTDAHIAGLPGTYRGINGTAGVLELHADGSYSYQGQPMGNWRQAGSDVVFNGQPFAFAGNRAALQSGGSVLMFRLGAAGMWYEKVN